MQLNLSKYTKVCVACATGLWIPDMSVPVGTDFRYDEEQVCVAKATGLWIPDVAVPVGTALWNDKIILRVAFGMMREGGD